MASLSSVVECRGRTALLARPLPSTNSCFSINRVTSTIFLYQHLGQVVATCSAERNTEHHRRSSGPPGSDHLFLLHFSLPHTDTSDLGTEARNIVPGFQGHDPSHASVGPGSLYPDRCDQCHERKVRCDKTLPCRRCSLNGSECRYTDRTKARTYSQAHVDTLERRIKRLEVQNRTLVQHSRTDPVSSGGQNAPVIVQGSLSTNDSGSSQHRMSADVAGEVSYLSINASGERNYLGSSSGVLLANFIRANVDIENSTRPTTPFGDDDEATYPTASATELSHDLLSEQIAKRLVLSYLNHDHLRYPVVLPATLLAMLSEAYSTDVTSHTRSASDAFIFDIVLAIATANIDRSSWQGLPSAHSHYTRAMKRGSTVLEKGGLGALQAVILLIQYRMSSSMQDTSASMWHLVGVGSRIALELGLHCETAYPYKRSDDSTRNVVVQQEVSRLCFWSIVAMDRIVSNILGRPLAIRNEDVDTALPSDLCDEILLSGVKMPTAEHLVMCRRIPIFVQIIKYRLLCGDIIETLHNKGRKSQSKDELRHRRDQFAASLKVWRLNAERVALSGSVDDAKPSSCFTSPTWFEMIYHNAVLMLHRPSPTLDTSRDSVAVHAIFTSSQASMSSYSSLHRMGLLNHSWLTLQALFMAGLSYVYAVTMHCQASRIQQGHQPSGLLNKTPSTMEVISDTRKCSNVLVAVSERWKSLRRCVDVFNRLSDAILIDIIKFSTNPNAATQFPTNNSENGNQQYSDRSESTVESHSNGSVQPPQWNHAPFLQPTGTDRMVSNPSPLAIENEFRGSVFDLQQMYDQQQVDMSVYRFSQAWFDSFDLYGGMGPQLNDITMDTHI